MSPWLLNIYMDGVMREMKGKVGEFKVKKYAEGRKWVMNSILSADDTVLIAENESDLQNLVSVCDSVCKSRKLKVNVNKTKVIVCEWSTREVVYFVGPFNEALNVKKESKINLISGEMEDVNEFKYFGSVMCKHGSTEGEKRERALQGLMNWRRCCRSISGIPPPCWGLNSSLAWTGPLADS